MKKKIISSIILLMLIPIAGYALYSLYNRNTSVNVKIVEQQLKSSEKKERNLIRNENLSGSEDGEQLAKVDAYVRKNQFSGTISVVKDGKMVLQNSYGQKNSQDGNTNDSAYRVNIQPLLNRAIIYHLITNGKINLNSKLDYYFPSLQNASSYSLNDLVKNNIYYYSTKKIPLSGTGTKILSFLNVNGKTSKKSMQGSNTINTFLLSQVISMVTKSDYDTYIQNTVLNDFGVLDAGLMDGTPFFQNYATNFDYIVKEKRLQYTVPFTSTVGYVPGADNWYSNNLDTLNIVLGILNGNYLKNQQINKLIKTPGLGLNQTKDNFVYSAQKNGCSFLFLMNSDGKSAKIVSSNVNAPKSILQGIVKQSSMK